MIKEEGCAAVCGRPRVEWRHSCIGWGGRRVPCLGEKYGTSGDACAFRKVDARVPCVRFISLLVI